MVTTAAHPAPAALGTETLCHAFQVTAAERPDQIALRTPGDGVTLTYREYAERVRRIATTPYDDELAQLTQQEQKILLLVAEGKTNKEIAAEVFLSDKTVKNYVSSILSKLNLQRRAQAAAYLAKRHENVP